MITDIESIFQIKKPWPQRIQTPEHAPCALYKE